MTSAGGPSDDDGSPAVDPVDLSKSGQPEPFDPYRFGKPDVPPPPEYAPPGYTPDQPTPAAPAYPAPAYPGQAYPGQAYPGQANPGQAYQGQPYQPAPPPSGNPYPPMPPQGQAPPPYAGYPPAPYQGSYPGQQPYGSPPPYGPYPGAQQGTGKAIAGMVLGIVSIVLCWVNFFNLLIVIPGIVFSLLGLNDAKSRGGRGRGQAITGLVCVAIGIVLTVIVTIFELHVSHNCSGIDHGATEYRTCVSDQF